MKADIDMCENEPDYTLKTIKEKANEVFGEPEITQEWLTSKIEGLGHQKPIEMIRHGQGDKVYDALLRIEYGIYS